jgi:archaellum component FlaG (FlaF/FlaG flagellin family)
MSNAIVTVFVVVLMLTAVLSWSQASVSSVDSGAQSLKDMAEAAQEASRTDFEVIGANKTAPFVSVYVHNCGRVHLADFSKWDVLVEYYDGNGTYRIVSLGHTEEADPSDEEWTVSTIFSDISMDGGEVFDPGILDPGEVMLVRMKLNPVPGPATTNRVTLSSPNGVVASAQFRG